MLPLYKELQNEPPGFTNAGNAGLWFNRFFNIYPENIKFGFTCDKLDISEGKRNKWFDDFVGKANESQDERNGVLEKQARRQIDLVRALRGCAEVYKTEWQFITGMGLPHPVENGFLWHPTLGVPYLPGAAVKGMVRSWLEAWGSDEEKNQLLNLFGSDDKDPEKQNSAPQAGDLIFFDALPVSGVQLGIDIMTPHMGDWYAQGNNIKNIQRESEKVPADWHDPVPIKYLVVKNAQFLFAIAPRKKAHIKEACDMMGALDAALTYIGAGAKTAVGYGFFAKDDDKLTELNASPEEGAKIKIAHEIKALGLGSIAKMLSRDIKKTEEAWGSDIDTYLECIKEVYGDSIRGWESSENKNQKKAFRVIFPSGHQ